MVFIYIERNRNVKNNDDSSQIKLSYLFIYLKLNTAQWCRTNIITLLLVQTKVKDLKLKSKAAIYQSQIKESLGSRQSKKKENIENMQT